MAREGFAPGGFVGSGRLEPEAAEVRSGPLVGFGEVCGVWLQKRRAENVDSGGREGENALVPRNAPPALRKVRTVLVTMFEPEGAAFGGELSLFREHYGLKPVDPSVAGLEGRVWWASEPGLLAVVTGVGTANTAVAPLLLALDGRFDLAAAWWLVSGIAGIDPGYGTIGDAIWADVCVDGDLAFEIHPADAPAGWPVGIFPLGSRAPFGPASGGEGGFQGRYEVQWLDPESVDWALSLTADALRESALGSEDLASRAAEPPAGGPGLAGGPAGVGDGYSVADPEPRFGAPLVDLCSRYGLDSPPMARPAVRRAAVLSACRFWHGQRMNDWARRWVDYWSGGRSVFAVSGMEDSGLLLAVERLARTGQADARKRLILRTASNFTMPPPGTAALESLAGPEPDPDGGSAEAADYLLPGIDLAREHALRVAMPVIDAAAGGD